MAVEARLHNHFPQFIGNREMMNPIEAKINLYDAQMGGYFSLLPVSGTTTTTTETLFPPAASNPLIPNSIPQIKTAMKSDSGLTFNFPVSKKRSRDSINYHFPSYPASTQQQPFRNCGNFSFLGKDISFQVQQHQLEIDRLISQRMEKVRMELEEKRNMQARKLLEAIEVGMMQRLKAKEEEIEKIGKLNWALEEKVMSLSIENQIWRDLAQTNEATANALRTNLEQVLAQVKDVRTCGGAGMDDGGATVAHARGAELMDDAQSCCGSTDDDGEAKDDGSEGWRTLAMAAQDKDGTGGEVAMRRTSNCNSMSSSGRLCGSCGKEESCVLILPCRHLCLCTVCGSTIHSCPICKSFKTASVHVNMS